MKSKAKEEKPKLTCKNCGEPLGRDDDVLLDEELCEDCEDDNGYPAEDYRCGDDQDEYEV